MLFNISLSKGPVKAFMLAVMTAGTLVTLSGCVAVPVVMLANLAHKTGTMTITLEGKGDPIKTFRESAVSNGGTVPSATNDFARAEFSTVDMKVEAQMTDAQLKTIVIRGSSLSNVGRTYEMKDNITEITEKVALGMQSKGFVVKSRQRDRGV